jgi:putative ABC transport system ATP-binding protein
MDSVIKLEDISFFYDKGKYSEVQALKNVNMDIKQGEYVSFFGPSGCGKSTILYIISGVERPDEGKVFINGQNIMDLSQRELAIYRQVGIGIVFQNFNLIPSISNIDNVALPMAFLGISAEKRKKKAMEILERLGIEQFANRYPHELSGGQQQRFGIARALANDPPIILADEPIGNLDSVNANNVLDLLKELNEKDGKTIIIVTHEAWSLRDVKKIFYMRDGSVTRIESKEQPKEFKKVGTGYYYKNLFPELPPVENRAKTISSMALRGYSQPEQRRLESFISQRLKGELDKDGLRTALDKSYNEGGVGLWRQKAIKITNYIEDIIEGEKKFNLFYKKIKEAPEAPLSKDVEDLRNWVLEEYKGALTPLQLERLDEGIGERARNIINTDHFRKILDLPKERGGVGLKIRSSFKIAEKLESIIGNTDKANEPTINSVESFNSLPEKHGS